METGRCTQGAGEKGRFCEGQVTCWRVERRCAACARRFRGLECSVAPVRWWRAARGGPAESNDEVLSETDVAFDKIKRVCSIRLYPSYSRPRWGVFKDIEKI